VLRSSTSTSWADTETCASTPETPELGPLVEALEFGGQI